MGVISRELLNTEKGTVMMDCSFTQMGLSKEEKWSIRSSMEKDFSNTLKTTYTMLVSGETINLTEMEQKLILKTVIIKASSKTAKSMVNTVNLCGKTVRNMLELSKMDLCKALGLSLTKTASTKDISIKI